MPINVYVSCQRKKEFFKLYCDLTSRKTQIQKVKWKTQYFIVSKLVEEPEWKPTIGCTLWWTPVYFVCQGFDSDHSPDSLLWKTWLVMVSCRVCWPLVSALVTKWFGLWSPQVLAYGLKSSIKNNTRASSVLWLGTGQRRWREAEVPARLHDGQFYISVWMGHGARYLVNISWCLNESVLGVRITFNIEVREHWVKQINLNNVSDLIRGWILS
jgi:hypothetical protein